MISIKKLISLNPDNDQPLIRVVRILIQAIGDHAVSDDNKDGTLSHEAINSLLDDVAEGIDQETLLVRVGSLINGLADQTRRRSKDQAMQTNELKNMIRMLASTVGEISAASQENASVLGEIQQQVASTSELTDIRLMKAKLSDCLTHIKKETDRQAAAMSATIERLNQELSEAQRRSSKVFAAVERDSVTGLPVRHEAEEAFRKWPTGARAVAALFVFDHLQILNQRFGREIGDELLHVFATLIQKRLVRVDRLFRWSGPAFVALLPRAGAIETIRGEIGRAMAPKMEHTIQSDSVSVLVPLTARWTIFPLMPEPGQLFQKLDAFTAAAPVGLR